MEGEYLYSIIKKFTPNDLGTILINYFDNLILENKKIKDEISKIRQQQK